MLLYSLKKTSFCYLYFEVSLVKCMDRQMLLFSLLVKSFVLLFLHDKHIQTDTSAIVNNRSENCLKTVIKLYPVISIAFTRQYTNGKPILTNIRFQVNSIGFAFLPDIWNNYTKNRSSFKHVIMQSPIEQKKKCKIYILQKSN